MEEGSESPHRRFRFITGHLAKITNDVGKTIGRTATSAGELLGDSSLRRKGAALFVREASKGLKGIQQGIGSAAGAVGRTIQNGAHGISQGPRQVQAVLGRIQQRIEQQRIAEMLEATRNQLVDVQMGNQLYEDAPQELRTRLWCILLESPDLGAVFRPLCVPDISSHRVPSTPNSESTASAARQPSTTLSDHCHAGTSGLNTDVEPESPQQSQPLNRPGSTSPGRKDSDGSDNIVQTSSSPHTRSSHDEEANVEAQESGELKEGPVESQASLGLKEAESIKHVEGSDDDWEIVTKPPPRILSMKKSRSMSSEPTMTPQDIGVQVLNAAMIDLAWPLPAEFSEESRYGTLLQITIGQDEVDDIINRDIHRTFPEHPHFNEEQGRVALFNVLKAYSVHDLEVEYCQGMAFVAGVLLLYLPEEFAFRLFCRIMGADGMNLRELYLPGLASLKRELLKLEWLLEKHAPRLHTHLQAHGIPAVLYASQWFLTAFACPFPPSFVARIIDIMLIENTCHIMQRVAFAILNECEEAVLPLTDFEDILTCLKVQPMEWSHETARQVLDYSLKCCITDEELSLAEAAIRAEESSPSKPEVSNFTRMGPVPPNPREPAPVDAQADSSTLQAEVPVREGLEEELETQRQEMASEELKVLLSMEMLWDANDSF